MYRSWPLDISKVHPSWLNRHGHRGESKFQLLSLVAIKHIRVTLYSAIILAKKATTAIVLGGKSNNSHCIGGGKQQQSVYWGGKQQQSLYWGGGKQQQSVYWGEKATTAIVLGEKATKVIFLGGGGGGKKEKRINATPQTNGSPRTRYCMTGHGIRGMLYILRKWPIKMLVWYANFETKLR